jgi:hypothetical protein
VLYRKASLMKVLLKASGHAEDGGSALLMHSERLADPLEPVVRQIKKITAKGAKKTDADHAEIGRLEFHGGMYVNGNGPCIPSWNILRSLKDGASRHKKGLDVLRGVYPQTDHVDLIYKGPRDPDELWKVGGFSLRKTVGVQRSRTMRTRPMFHEWSLELLVEVDPKVFDFDTLQNCWADAGVYCGLGDMRPIYGRFKGTAELVK